MIDCLKKRRGLKQLGGGPKGCGLLVCRRSKQWMAYQQLHHANVPELEAVEQRIVREHRAKLDPGKGAISSWRGDGGHDRRARATYQAGLPPRRRGAEYHTVGRDGVALQYKLEVCVLIGADKCSERLAKARREDVCVWCLASWWHDWSGRGGLWWASALANKRPGQSRRGMLLSCRGRTLGDSDRLVEARKHPFLRECTCLNVRLGTHVPRCSLGLCG
mmetsp:Transcript_76749/g.152146  ORF Transcript_76749/g.152146 Transcript_76749/m.152146 type:complete len:219 (+) Transcript_76749:2933-3589(+)